MVMGGRAFYFEISLSVGWDPSLTLMRTFNRIQKFVLLMKVLNCHGQTCTGTRHQQHDAQLFLHELGTRPDPV